MVQSQNKKDFGLIQTTLLDNHDDELYNKKINSCSQNQVSTPPTSPFLYASYESSLSCDTSCSSTSLSPILTPTTSTSSSYPTLNSIPSLPASPIKSKYYDDLNQESTLFNQYNPNPSLVQNVSTSNELSYNNVKDNAFNQQQNINNQRLNQQNQYYYYQSKILSLIENQQQQYLKCKEFNDEQYKIDSEFLNSNLNLFNWTFFKPKFPLLFDQMYDKANGCFFLTGIPVEFIFDLSSKYDNQDLLTQDFNNEL
jgi:hypothetical protein